jgi:hypothetical protein
MPMNFVEFACQYLREDIKKEFPDYKAKAFRKIIRDLLSMFIIVILLID